MDHEVEVRIASRCFPTTMYTVRTDPTILVFEHSYGGYVHTISNRIKITPNYGNPIEDFADDLQQLLPDVPIIETRI